MESASPTPRATADASVTMPLSRPGATENRWYRGASVAPYVLMVLLIVVTVAERSGQAEAMIVDLSLCAVTIVWMLSMFTLHPAWRVRPAPMTIFFVGVLALTAVLVVRDPWFGFFTPAAYFFAFSVLLWPWELLGVGSVAVIAAIAQTSSVPKNNALGVIAFVAVAAINVLPLCGLSWLGHRGEIQADERERTLTELSEANRRLEATLAENAGLHEQLLAQAREAGMLDERQRMAREIHDTLAQGLTGIITQLQAAIQAADAVGVADTAAIAATAGRGADTAGRRPDTAGRGADTAGRAAGAAGPSAGAAGGAADAKRHVEAAIRLARESLSEARRSVHALRPEPLDGGQPGVALTGALTDVAERWSGLHGIPVRVVTTGTPRALPPEAEVALLRTAQEALANVARHAKASRVGVTLSYLDADVALDVRDDGCGFTPPDRSNSGYAQDGGFGLVAMRQRIEAIAGTLQIESEPGAGTAISARVPAQTVASETVLPETAASETAPAETVGAQ